MGLKCELSARGSPQYVLRVVKLLLNGLPEVEVGLPTV